MSKLLFLDFDGVLNSGRYSNSPRAMDDFHEDAGKIDPDAVVHLNRIIEATDCYVVISSNWRKANTMGGMLRMLVSRGLDKKHWDNFIGVTPALEGRHGLLFTAPSRGDEIKAWLDRHPEHQENQVVILDDNPELGLPADTLVACNSSDGLTAKLAQEVISRFA